MGTPQETDERLRRWLDSNQLARERLCQAILALDKRFSNVRPRQPRGGPDGGRDLDASFQDGRHAFAAVGFLNSVSDSPEQKRAIQKKFSADLETALAAEPELKVFVFLTNVSLTVGEKGDLEKKARAKGIDVVDIYDRERLRIVLDGTDGFAARFQYLGLEMTAAEQAAFFAKWGDGVEELITKSSAAVDAKLQRIEFIHEQHRPLTSITFSLGFGRQIDLTEVLPRLRAMMAIRFAPMTSLPSGRLHMLTCRDRGEWKEDNVRPMPGYASFVSYCWAGEPNHLIKRDLTFQSHKVIGVTVSLFAGGFGSAVLGKTLGNLDHGLVSFFANESLAKLVTKVTVIANEYIIWHASSPEIEQKAPDNLFPVAFTAEELADPWVQIVGKIGTGWFDFSRFTPRRLFHAEEISSPI